MHHSSLLIHVTVLMTSSNTSNNKTRCHTIIYSRMHLLVLMEKRGCYYGAPTTAWMRFVVYSVGPSSPFSALPVSSMQQPPLSQVEKPLLPPHTDSSIVVVVVVVAAAQQRRIGLGVLAGGGGGET
mmetsp:Transcript_20706/g.43320  ORF Transcript_20706/g.43320 Transcript_20706/m.43320 type:complete len:126 (-) Transcript_20706:282-659(-)